jgi:catechol 2,3-dioxygenase-like lactoylglutathione lyase family enzyme
VQYYENVAETMGGASRISQSYRLFMVPGMAHCGGGDGTSTFDVMGALERWVEKGTPPDRIEASRVRNGTTDRTRPLCPYPQVATYRGTGSTNESSSFTCAAGSAVQERPQAAASIEGLDHIPIAVNDLERAADLYRSLGFALKPGRPHDNGIRNVHAKFADGTELELITAPAARDALTRTYRNHLAKGDGPAFLAFYARSVDRAEERLAGLPYIFFGSRNQSPTDRPEHFAHANTATSLIGVWLAADDFSRERRLLQDLGATIREQDVQTPDPIRTAVALVPDGRVLLLPATRQRVPGRRVIGATLRVTSLSAARDVLSKAPAPVPRALRETGTSLFLPPEVTHGLWLELCECR